MSAESTAQASSRRPEAGMVPPAQEPESELNIWSTWLTQAAAAGADFAELFALEVRLAVGDARRLLMLAMIAIPLLLFAWLGFSVLIAWLVGEYLTSVIWGLAAFLGIQLIVLGSLVCLWQRYKRSLKLPLTRQYLHAFMGGLSANEARTTDLRDRSS